jgi:hypothetical protein
MLWWAEIVPLSPKGPVYWPHPCPHSVYHTTGHPCPPYPRILPKLQVPTKVLLSFLRASEWPPPGGAVCCLCHGPCSSSVWGVFRRGLWELVISIVVLSDLQAEFGPAPATEDSKKAKCSTAAFPKLFMFKERSRNTGFSCYNVTFPPWELVLHLLVYHWM